MSVYYTELSDIIAKLRAIHLLMLSGGRPGTYDLSVIIERLEKLPLPNAVDDWRSIDTAPTDRPVLLAHFSQGEQPDYVVLASYTTLSPGFIQCASYEGWMVEMLPLMESRFPPKHMVIASGFLSKTEFAPTHWRDA